MRRLHAIATAFVLVFIGCALASQRATPRERLELTAAPVRLHPDKPGVRRVGDLLWRGGLELAGDSGAFGGLSALAVGEDGRRMTAVGDKGSWVEAELTYTGGELSGVRRAVIDGLRGTDGMPVRAAAYRDGEAMTRLDDGALLVAFEQRHRLWRYPAGAHPLAAAAEPVPAPARLSEAGGNFGAEALVALADGRLLMLTEGLRAGAHRLGFLRVAGAWRELAYPRDGGYKPTAAAQLPGGDLLVLERRFDVLAGFKARLRRIALADVRAGALLDGPVIAGFRPPLMTGNFEGLAVRRDASGETLLYLLSDDNFNALQRTLLLMLELRPVR